MSGFITNRSEQTQGSSQGHKVVSEILDLGTVTCRTYQVGAGPDFLWIPGGDQTGDVYLELFKDFAGSHRCISYDPRGAGETKSLSGPPWSIEDLAADCAALIEAMCSPPVIVTGLSMGALVVQELALSYPHLVRLAIPMGTMADKTGFAREWEDAEIHHAANGGRLSGDLAIVHYAFLTYPAEVLGDDALWARCKTYISDAYEDRDPKMLAAQWEACVNYSSRDRLPDCRVPMHVIAFSQDVQTPPSRGKAVAELAANGHFHLLEGLGHYSMFGHRPRDVCDCIKAIIESERD